MLSVLHTALAGMTRNQQGVQTAAANVANVNTDGYRTQRLDTESAQTVDADPSAERPDDWPDDRPYNDVDLAGEMVRMKTYEVGFRANAKVVAVADRMLGELMDIFA